MPTQPTDRYAQFVGTAPGTWLSSQLGLPRPAELRRAQPGKRVLDGPALVVGTGLAPLRADLADLLRAAGTDVLDELPEEAADHGGRLAAIVVDATGLREVAELEQVRAAVVPAFRRLAPSGRLLVVAAAVDEAATVAAAAVQQGLEGFVRSAAKEARAGATANLVRVRAGASAADWASTVEFFCSGRSAYVDGQVVTVGPAPAAAPAQERERPVAVVTGAAQGIGAAIAEALARGGAHVVCVDIAAQGEALAQVANRVGGTALHLDITSASAPAALAEHLRTRHGGADVIVHNAGITRDKLLVNTDADRWASVLEVNLAAELRIDDALLETEGALHAGARFVCLSSLSGIAGNRGQVNYSTSKAGVIGAVRAMAPLLAKRGMTANAVAPGFIETAMTARMPVATREMGRRANSLQQGGRPEDVAETVAWLADPRSRGVNGQVVRVCGQSLLGA
ncbi:3-oxoacyl-[acyl-carrier protein] reductase [Kineococcus xinjiangensis]|uniref:3-oxoacyl-[acyl-carrier protein] reductase n=1 Tax=Kineococcus xinjiangensis TaxID=512762 RepID=A0A2S6ID17_9ACTN|nr:3-oxoacyl-ACP reductase [Kineococcus xinjiangensis]PPK92118.1 3-oxoacyl-[acyl-carrier protein] reductase [Kineococcus xinjiangensis]